ncbi:phosphatidylethanolamine-binding protein [Thelonectria olida]|uniref:Phosphatidylethanolamine-binding protein n=1 Tax=Thelonectria olida TaxID=1576542 RepID=A0A9P8WDB3_9HYPO|nr:phosphatidylethanolamine-binding protein [Thelonectria olida]
MRFSPVILLLVGGVLAQTPPGFSPSTNATLGVKYGTVSASKGSLVAIDDAAMSPSLSFASTASPSHGSHVVVMVDLDAPNGTHDHPYAAFLHWLAFLPSGVESLPGNASNASDFAPYFGPAPPPGTGPHRYTVLLFKSENITLQVPPSFKSLSPATNISDRITFDIDKFADEGGLELAAANWFTSENETGTSENKTTTVTNGAPHNGSAGVVAAAVLGLLSCLFLAI